MSDGNGTVDGDKRIFCSLDMMGTGGKRENAQKTQVIGCSERFGSDFDFGLSTEILEKHVCNDYRCLSSSTILTDGFIISPSFGTRAYSSNDIKHSIKRLIFGTLLTLAG